jgi:hypothetical protein
MCVPRPSVAVGRLGANLALNVAEIPGLYFEKYGSNSSWTSDVIGS